MRRLILFVLPWAMALGACAPQARLATAPTAVPSAAKPVWAFEGSDIPLDPGYRFGRLDNGLRYVLRHNATPRGTAMVRMEVAAGSLDEADSEQGYAHFVEHMAFNGSTQVPEGEMVRLLERNGLAFGADTNASTGFETTTYMLDLPRNDPALLDVALMLMRETASELTISPEAVARERGVILSEMRDRNTWQFRNGVDQARFLHPQARYPRRFPIGTADTLNAATAESLRAFWRRTYVPGRTTLVVVGDFDADAVEAAIRQRFANWPTAPVQAQPDPGPVDTHGAPRGEAWIDPALSERITASRHGPWIEEPDSVAQRRETLLRQIGYAIVNRRLQRLSRQANPPFRGGGFGTGDVFKAGRTTNLIVDTVDGKWRRGLAAAAIEYRRALHFGFGVAEVAEQVANIRTAAQDQAASAATRSNAALVNAVFDLLRNDRVPSSPETALERLEAFIPAITPETVLAALRREAVPLDDPLLRFQGRRPPQGGVAAIRQAWRDAMRVPLSRSAEVASTGFAYTDFGQPGTVASDRREPLLGIREVRFANNVRLNIKRTDIEKDRVQVRIGIDGGDMLNTRANPLATQMVPMLPAGGLGKHSQDELQSVLAGHAVGLALTSTPERFVSSAQTTPRDLELQLQALAALVSDPGYRPEGELQYRLTINTFFAQYRATPGAALGNALGGLLSDEDPRFSLQPVDAYRKLTFAKLRADLADRLAHGAIEIGIVGDIDEDAAIALVARTFGALPVREADFRAYDDQRQRPFTQDTTRRIVRHTGPADQAMLRITWPTRDESDPVAAMALKLLERIVRIELTETLRETLGKAYSPGATSAPSRVWRGYGTFAVAASVAVPELPATRAAIAQAIAGLRDRPIPADLLLRARQPLMEAYDNALKGNAGWLGLVDRAQGDPEEIDRFTKARTRLMAITPAEIEALAQRYLAAGRGVEIVALPEGVEEPKS